MTTAAAINRIVRMLKQHPALLDDSMTPREQATEILLDYGMDVAEVDEIEDEGFEAIVMLELGELAQELEN